MHLRRLKSLVRSLFPAMLALCAVWLFHDWSHNDSGPSILKSIDPPPSSNPFSLSRLEKLEEDIQPLPVSDDSPIAFSKSLQALLDAGQNELARSQLMQQALSAVEAENQPLLAASLAQLGVLTLEQGDTADAEGYLSESLSLFEQTGDELGGADVYMQLGRLHLIERQRARRASSAYDQLLLARWKISKGQFYQAEPDLLQIVEDNLALKRFGAAASTWETLQRGYHKVLDDVRAIDAGYQAIALHASSGNIQAARRMLERLRLQGADRFRLAEFDRQIESLYAEYETSALKLGAARDYEQLHNQLIAKGDIVTAWRFRLQADATSSKASNRARYRRQPDVLVELYRSNDSMAQASKSVERAGRVYQRFGFQERLQNSQQLSSEIY